MFCDYDRTRWSGTMITFQRVLTHILEFHPARKRYRVVLSKTGRSNPLIFHLFSEGSEGEGCCIKNERNRIESMGGAVLLTSQKIKREALCDD